MHRDAEEELHRVTVAFGRINLVCEVITSQIIVKKEVGADPPASSPPSSELPGEGGSGGSGASGSASEAAASGPVGGGPRSSRVIGVAFGLAARRGFYVVFSTPKEHSGLLGVHHACWEELKDSVPGGKIIGCPCRDWKKFGTLEEAQEYFGRRAVKGTPCVIHEY